MDPCGAKCPGNSLCEGKEGSYIHRNGVEVTEPVMLHSVSAHPANAHCVLEAELGAGDTAMNRL